MRVEIQYCGRPAITSEGAGRSSAPGASKAACCPAIPPRVSRSFLPYCSCSLRQKKKTRSVRASASPSSACASLGYSAALCWPYAILRCDLRKNSTVGARRREPPCNGKPPAWDRRFAPTPPRAQTNQREQVGRNLNYRQCADQLLPRALPVAFLAFFTGRRRMA
jgi:hypothetical protein